MALTDNLEAYWRLDEESGTREDRAGSNDLTDNGTVLYATGKVGNAADFVEANTEYLSIADNASLSTGNEDMSMILWVNIDDTAGEHRIASKWTAQIEYLLEEGGATADRFTWWVGDTSGSCSVGATTYGDTSAAVGNWVMIFVYVDITADEIGISINDGTVDTAVLTITPADGTDPFYLGYNSTTVGLDGQLDEVGFWKRKLTSTEVTTLYNSGNGITHPFHYPSLAGSFVSTGAVAKKSARALAGPLVLAGTVAKKAKRALAGAITFAGTLVGKAKKALAGAITFTGTSVLERLWFKFLARFRNYTFPAPQRFTIVSSAIQFMARYRDYAFNAPKRDDMATAKDVWLEGSPGYLVEGATPKITVPFSWASTITGTPTVEMYKDGSSTDTAGTYMPSGSVTTSGASLTTKALADLVPAKYVIVINATVDGVADVWKLGIVVQKQEALW